MITALLLLHLSFTEIPLVEAPITVAPVSLEGQPLRFTLEAK